MEADRWVDTADPAALDAWGREPSPEPASRATAELQRLGESAQTSDGPPRACCAGMRPLHIACRKGCKCLVLMRSIGKGWVMLLNCRW